jgi:hypothetical protein
MNDSSAEDVLAESHTKCDHVNRVMPTIEYLNYDVVNDK